MIELYGEHCASIHFYLRKSNCWQIGLIQLLEANYRVMLQLKPCQTILNWNDNSEIDNWLIARLKQELQNSIKQWTL